MSDIRGRDNGVHDEVKLGVDPNGMRSNLPSDDEIDLLELWKALWGAKWIICVVSFVFSLVGVVYSLALPDIYRSEGVYAPSELQDQANGLLAKYSGLASIAGINLPGGGGASDIDQAIEIVESWPFLEAFVNENNLKHLIMAVKEWSSDSGEFIWGRGVYDPVEGAWVKNDGDSNESGEPTSFEVYKKLRGMIELRVDSKTSLVYVSVEHYSPYVAKEWVELLVNHVNEQFRLRDTSKATENIKFLKTMVEKTSISGMQSVFYGMLEEQMKTLMLAQVEGGYLLDEVVEPKVAELRSEPRRTLIVLMTSFLGWVLSVLAVLGRCLVGVHRSRL